LAELADDLSSGCYDITVPEEGALLVVAWLAKHGHGEIARQIVEVIAPYFSTLRFYAAGRAQPVRFGSRVHVETIGEAGASIDDPIQL
jgi:hypothetical protein